MAFNSADTAAFKNVWVFCEQRQGVMMPTTFELILSLIHISEPTRPY